MAVCTYCHSEIDAMAISCPNCGKGFGISDEADELSDRKLFSPNRVILTTLLGGVLGGGIAISLNFRSIHESRKAQSTLIVTLISAVIYTTILLFLPEESGVLKTFSWLLPCIVANSLVRSLFNESFILHRQANGGLYSIPQTLGLGIGAMICNIIVTVTIGTILFMFGVIDV